MDVSLYRRRPPYATLTVGFALFVFFLGLSVRDVYRGCVLLLRGETKSGVVVRDGINTCSVQVQAASPPVIVLKPRAWLIGWEKYPAGSAIAFRQDPGNTANARIVPIQIGSLLLLLFTGTVVACVGLGISVWLFRRARGALNNALPGSSCDPGRR
jgi:hypothetical protein